MEAFEIARDKAVRHIKIADHMLTQTYPLIKDPKLLITVLDNVYSSLENSMNAILLYERFFKRIPPYHDNFDSKINIFRERCSRRYNFKSDYVTLISMVREIMNEHKDSNLEFARKGTFVICSDDYKTKTVSIEKIKMYIGQTKEFVNEMNNMVDRK